MEFGIILLCFAVSIDAFVAGFAIGLQDIKCDLNFCVATFIINFLFSFFAVFLGSCVAHFVEIEQIGFASGFVVVALGVYTLWQGYKEKIQNIEKTQTKKTMESLAIIVGVGIDASIASFALGLMGFNIWVPVFIGAFHAITVKAGNTIGVNEKVFNALKKYWYIPGGILVLLGIWMVV